MTVGGNCHRWPLSNGSLRMIAPMPWSPAAAAGMRPRLADGASRMPAFVCFLGSPCSPVARLQPSPWVSPTYPLLPCPTLPPLTPTVIASPCVPRSVPRRSLVEPASDAASCHSCSRAIGATPSCPWGSGSTSPVSARNAIRTAVTTRRNGAQVLPDRPSSCSASARNAAMALRTAVPRGVPAPNPPAVCIMQPAPKEPVAPRGAHAHGSWCRRRAIKQSATRPQPRMRVTPNHS